VTPPPINLSRVRARVAVTGLCRHHPSPVVVLILVFPYLGRYSAVASLAPAQDNDLTKRLVHVRLIRPMVLIENHNKIRHMACQREIQPLMGSIQVATAPLHGARAAHLALLFEPSNLAGNAEYWYFGIGSTIKDRYRGAGEGESVAPAISDYPHPHTAACGKLKAGNPITGNASDRRAVTRRRPSSAVLIMAGTSLPGSGGITGGLLARP
jgi:hypothetical protein